MTRAVQLLVACGAFLAVTGCGDSEDRRDAAVKPPKQDRALIRCVGSWNGSAGDRVRALAEGLAREGHATARMFAFSDGACGMTIPGKNAPVVGLTTYAERGGRFEPYINTAGQGFGQRPDPAMLSSALQLEREAQSAPNVDVRPDGSVVQQDGARLASVEIASMTQVDSISGANSGDDRPYVLDAAGWDALSIEEKLAAIAAYAVDRNCSRANGRRVAEALMDGVFQVVDDSVESTLGRWCGGETPTASEPPPTGESSDGTPTYEMPTPKALPGCAGVSVLKGDVTCKEAQEVFDRLSSGDGVVRAGPTANGDQVGEWNCFGARMGSPTMCDRAGDHIEDATPPA